MVTQLQDVANTVAQEKISNQRLRNEAIRKQMANPWSAPTESTQPTTNGTQPRQDVTSGTPTLASTYSGLLNNFQSTLGNAGRTEGGFNQPEYKGNRNPMNIPGWMPSVVGAAGSILGNGMYGGIGSAATSLMRGDTAGAAGTLGNLFTNAVTKGSVPGLGSIVGTIGSGLIKGKPASEIGYDVSNSALGTGLGMLNPVLGVGYNLARMFGLDVSRGISDYSKSDIDQRFNAGLHGGWFGGTGTTEANKRTWSPVAPDSPTNTYSGSGYGNTSGPGSGGSSSGSSLGYSNPASSYGSW